MTDVHALSGAYAVDALDDLERARFERHLGECPDCRAEVASLQEASAELSATAQLAPPADLRDRVLASIETVRPLPPVVADLSARADRRRRRFQGLVAAAAAVVLLGVGGAAVWQPWADEPAQAPVASATDEVLQADDAERYRLEIADGATATVVRSSSLNKAVLAAPGMAPAPEGHTYAVWLQHDEVMVLAGVITDDDDTEAILLSGDAATADGAGITLEVAGSEPREPSPDVVALVGFERT